MYMYASIHSDNILKLKTLHLIFLVCEDGGLWTQLGGSALNTKSNEDVIQYKYGTDFLHSLSPGTLILVDVTRTVEMTSSVWCAFKRGPLKALAVLPLIDREVLESSILLDRMNLTIQCCWTAGITVMKPSVISNHSARHLDGSILNSEITSVATMIKRAQIKYENWCIPTNWVQNSPQIIFFLVCNFLFLFRIIKFQYC